MSSNTARFDADSALQPSLKSNSPLLYKGRRMLVIDNTQRQLDNDYDIVVWDKGLDCAVGFCSQEKDGTFTGWVAYGQHELPVGGDTPRELAQSVLKAVNWTLGH